MSFFLSTGPALMYVGARSVGASPVYLGTFEKRPNVKVNPSYQPVMNDLGGPTLELENMYFGEDAEITGVMNKINMNVIRGLMKNTGAAFVPNAVAGAVANVQDGSDNLGGAYGSMMIQDGLAFILYMAFSSTLPGAPTAAARAAQQLPQGYRFLATFLRGPHEITPGSGALGIAVSFKAMRATALGTTAAATQLDVYDNGSAADLTRHPVGVGFAAIPGIN